MPCCGSSEPGTLATASRNSRISAMRIEVSCRHTQRSQPWAPNRLTRPVPCPPVPGPPPLGCGGLVPAGPACEVLVIWGSRSSGLRRHPLDEALEAGVGHRADHPGRDPAAARYHQCGGNPGGRHGVTEIKGDRVARVVQARVADPEVTGEG